MIDLLSMGRSSLDLYSNDVGSPFVEIGSFAAYVGGSPTNICVGGARLGLKTALLTAVGDDPVGDFVLHFLRQEGVDCQFVARKPGFRTSAVVLGIEPPDRFPLVFYRDRCADVEIDIDDVLAAPACRAFCMVGTNLSKEPSRSATLLAAERAREAGATIYLDLDFRPGQWHDPRAFGVAVRASLPLVDVVIGTQDEVNAVFLTSSQQLEVTQSESDTAVEGDLNQAVSALRSRVPALVLKRGAAGATVFAGALELDCPGFPVQVNNILGAGDAFAAGLIYGRLQGWNWDRAARLGNGCGAWVVQKHGCANFMARPADLEAFACL